MTGGAEASGEQVATKAPGWIRRLFGLWRVNRLHAVLVIVASVVAAGAVVIVPVLQRLIVDDGIVAGRRSVPVLCGLLLAAGAIAYGATYLRRYSAGRLSLDIQHEMRTGIFRAVSELDGAGQDELQTGQLVSRATSDLGLVQWFVANIPLALTSLLLFVLSLAVMVWLSPLLTLIAVAVAPASWWVVLLSRRRLFPATWDAQQQEAGIARVVDDAVAGVRVVKGFGQEQQELSKLADVARRLFGSRVRVVRLNGRYTPTLNAIPALGQVGVLAFGGWLALHGTISLGTFLAFSTYLAQLVGPAHMLSGLLTAGQQARAGVIRVFEVIDSKTAVRDAPDARSLRDPNSLTGSPRAGTAPTVEFDAVGFGYVASQPVLQGLTLTARPGETLAVVGSSGSGKSTISLLLPRFYDVTTGTIRIAGHDIRHVTLDSLRAAIGLVLEDSFLFSESVRDNIAYGRPDATDDEIIASAKAAEAHEFITALPDGYDTKVGEQGVTLSGGQRQRVALARALITDPAILVLDDATSAVDARVEADIHATLRNVMTGRTTIVIAHRRSTLALADRIAVLDKGHVTDIGTEQELLDRCPLYRLLISGPGDDAEGIDAGELPREHAATGQSEPGLAESGITESAWMPLARSSSGPGHRQVVELSGGAGSMWMRPTVSAPTPQLLARVAALPPPTDTPDVDETTARAPDPRFSLRRLLRPVLAPLAVALLLVAADAVASLVLPILVRDGIDQGVARHRMAIIAVVSLVGLAVLALDWLASTGQLRVTGRTGERVLYTLRVKVFAHLQRLGLDYYEREMSGRIMTRMTTDVDAVSSFLQNGLTQALVAVLTLAGILIALLVIDPTLGLVACSVLPVVVVATLIFRAKSSAAYTQAREKVGTVNADLQENAAGMRVTQAYRRVGRNRDRFSEHSSGYRSVRMRAQHYMAVYFGLLDFLRVLAGVLVLLVGAGQARTGALSIGVLIAYLLYIDMFFAPVQQLSQVFDGYQQAAVGLRRIRELLRTPTSTPAAADPVPLPDRLPGEIIFDNVSFSYHPELPPALAEINLRVAPGETIAVVGETGAGKSTLVKLVSRFYDVTTGTIRVDGTDIRHYNLYDYRHHMGIVPQEVYLFPGTVADAIAYGRPHATPTQIEAAARAVGAHDMIAHLDGGYHHHITERGRNLSAGQRQLLALARAQLVHPDILIMDEATAALDLASEAAVIRASQQLAGHRTTLVVAHRLTTAARADRIVVLDHGHIIEFGTHADLLAINGHYARQWRTFTGQGDQVIGKTG